jgi:hypothetical protein
MLRHGQTGWLSAFDENDVASALAIVDPASFLEGPNGALPGDGGERWRQMGTSTSRTSTVKGI